MSLTIEEIHSLHESGYNANQTTRERGSDDLVFYWVTQWDDTILDETQLSYRGEFDVLRKAGRNIQADLTINPVQVDFEPDDDERMDSADLLDGLYRKDGRNNQSIEAFNNADQENIVCGMGAWLLYTEYETIRGLSRNQVIRRRPIYEANNCVFFDPNSKSLDKSDAKWVSVLFAYTEDGYKNLVEELTGERPDRIDFDSFEHPEQSYTFPWILGQQKLIYVGEFYHRELIKKKVFVLMNPFGMTTTITEDQMAEVEDSLIESGYEIVSEKTIERYQVTKYIVDGKQILNGEITYDEMDSEEIGEYESDDEAELVEGERSGEIIAGQHLPVVPVYGEHAVIEGEEHWEGVTRLAKDPQRLRNFVMSFLADIASRSPREKPIFNADQVRGYENMYQVTGADNNYPYLLQNRLAPDGSPLPVGAIGMLPAPNIPPALASTIDLTRQAIEDVANPGIPQDIADPDLSGKAVLALQARIDMQSMVYQEHRKHAQRRDGEIYASMASEIYDVPRTVKIELPDGRRKSEKVMETVVDKQTGEIKVLRDLTNIEFQVYSEISSPYSSKRQETLDRLEKMIADLPPGDPMRNILILKYLKLMDGVDFEDVREYANKQLLLLGIRQPENPEEEQMLAQQAQQGEKPSAEMVLAQAEMLKGQADMAREQREAIRMQLEAKNKDEKLQVDVFKAQTDRMDTQINAAEAGATIDYKRADALGKKIENKAKIIQMRQPHLMSDAEIIDEIYSA